MTSTMSLTATPSATQTGTFTRTPTATVPGGGNTPPVIYPNPCDGTKPAQIHTGLTAPSDVKVVIFTAAFRKVQERFFPQVPAGASISLEVSDRWGTPLASGLYYVVVQSSQGRNICKLLVLR